MKPRHVIAAAAAFTFGWAMSVFVYIGILGVLRGIASFDDEGFDYGNDPAGFGDVVYPLDDLEPLPSNPFLTPAPVGWDPFSGIPWDVV